MGTDLMFEMIERLTPQLEAGYLEGCELVIANTLRNLPQSPFHIALELNITNDPAQVAQQFDDFFRQDSCEIDIEAIYTEMNGFYINPDLWFCDIFSYQEDGGIDDFDWLAHWYGGATDSITITGLEPLQKVYASDAVHDRANEDAREMCTLLVVAKFQRFMQIVCENMVATQVPVYATAHDFDYIARIEPPVLPVKTNDFVAAPVIRLSDYRRSNKGKWWKFWK